MWQLFNQLKNFELVDLTHPLDNTSPYWSGIPAGSVELGKTCFDWGNPMLDCLIQTFKFPGQFGTHVDFPGHFVKDGALSESYGAVNMIYATYNNMGNNLNYSYSTIGQYTANSELYIPATLPGYYGVNFYGSTPTNQPQNVILRADILPFELIAVNDNHGGNTGVVTVELTGSRFRPDMEVCLRHGHEVICADTLIYVNYYQAFAQFDLTGRTPGVYDVSAVNFCEGEAVLAEAFTIENGQPSGLAYNLLFPSSPRPNRTVVMMLEFGNTIRCWKSPAWAARPSP